MVTLEEITIINAPIERCFDLARNVDAHMAGSARSGETALDRKRRRHFGTSPLGSASYLACQASGRLADLPAKSPLWTGRAIFRTR